jgi:hypothetical protein
MKQRQSFSCPNCGGTVPAKAAACPHCGSDEQTGWSEGTYLDGIDLGDDFDYEETLSGEFSPDRTKQIHSGRLIVIALLLLLFLVALIRSLL